MAWHIRYARILALGVGQGACLFGLGGCILGGDRPDADRSEVSPSALIAPAARQSQAPSRLECRPPSQDGGGTATTRVLLEENWDLFDSGLWRGDGDQWVADGMFAAREGAESATADWSPGGDGALAGGRVLRFSNQLVSKRDASGGTPAREALFFLSGDEGESFQNYLFVSVRYSADARALSLEAYGASGGVEFDQGVDLPWTPPADRRLALDVEIDANAYRILLDGEPVDGIALSRALGRVTVFEVGVQTGPEGSTGLIDRTAVSLDTPGAGGGSGCRNGYGCPGFPHGCRKAGSQAHWRARARLAKAKLAHCARPSRGLKALARIRG
jgi:hypothetical protein